MIKNVQPSKLKKTNYAVQTGIKNRRSSMTNDALWALYRRYNGKIPPPSDLEGLQTVLNLKKKTIYKWFWDRIRKDKIQNRSNISS